MSELFVLELYENCLFYFRCTQQTKRIIYLVKEYHPLLDSSNMNMNDWAKIVNDIYVSKTIIIKVDNYLLRF